MRAGLGLLLAWGLVPAAQAAEFVVSTAATAHYARDLAEARLSEAYRRLGHSLRFERMPLERGLISANTGVVDADLTRTFMGHAEYANLLPIRVPVAEDDLMAFAKGQRLKVAGWPSLQPYRLVSVRGIRELEKLDAAYRVQFVTSAEQVFRFLDMGRADLAILTRGSQCLPSQFGLPDIVMQEPAIASVRFYHHVHQRHAALVPALEAELGRMQKDGSMQRSRDEMRRKWSRCDSLSRG